MDIPTKRDGILTFVLGERQPNSPLYNANLNMEILFRHRLCGRDRATPAHEAQLVSSRAAAVAERGEEQTMQRWGQRGGQCDAPATSSPGSDGSDVELGVGGLSGGGDDHLCGRRS
jgi:hypothetical protein